MQKKYVRGYTFNVNVFCSVLLYLSPHLYVNRKKKEEEEKLLTFANFEMIIGNTGNTINVTYTDHKKLLLHLQNSDLKSKEFLFRGSVFVVATAKCCNFGGWG